ncbi:MAG TPA: hypothetical protein VM692_13950 [Gammaproteobacteria bacterium]|nr:hypothetical protein [Gammaproteobacteria bacterium]
MAEDKRNRGDQQQGGNQSQDRQRGNKDRKPGGSMESPDSSRTPQQDDEEQAE